MQAGSKEVKEVIVKLFFLRLIGNEKERKEREMSVTLVTGCDPKVPPNYDRNTPPSAYFYEHNCTDRMRRLAVRAGQKMVHPAVVNAGMNDNVTSVVIPPNTTATIYADRCMQTGDAGQCKHQRQLGPGQYYLPNEKYTSGAGMNDNMTEVKVDSIKPHQEWLKDCCFGKVSPASDCANFGNPNSADCIGLITEWCSNKGNFYTADCRRWMQNLGDAQRNSIARSVCSQASSPQEKEWCACFIPRDIPPEFEGDTAIKALWPCLDPVCNDATKALQPYEKNCPNTLNICKQTDIVTKLQGSDVGSTRIANECGQIKLGGGGGDTTAAAAPRSSETTATKSKTPLIVGGVAGGVILILLIIVIVLAVRGKRR